MIHPIKFLRWSWDAGLRDTWYVVSYPFRTWRCRLCGHDWGPEQNEYEPNTYTLMETWHDCQRPGCEGYQQTYHYIGGDGGMWG